MTELQEILNRFWTDLLSRPNGPYGFRFMLQPVMGAIVALLDGIKDARTGRSPYFWTILSNPEKRSGRLHEGLKATTRIILLGVAMELLYQYKMFDTFYPGEAIAIIFFLAFLPYLLLRGSFARLAWLWFARKEKDRQ